MFGHSVLQLIDKPVRDLAAACARLLRPGGIAVFTLPVLNAENRAISLVRRSLRSIRCNALDTAIIKSAGVFGINAEERLEYLYSVHPHFYSEEFATAFAEADMHLVDVRPIPRLGPLAYRHVLIEFWKAQNIDP